MQAMPETTTRLQDSSLCNCLAIRQAARHVSQFYDRYLAADGLRTTQYSILARLSRLGPLSINELAALMVMDRTTLGRTLQPLERERLLTVSPGRDRRTRNIALTAAGKARWKAAAARWREAQQAFEAAYGSGEAAQLRADLARVIAMT
jgi:DNA-binding MarR family transcriptional regulator